MAIKVQVKETGTSKVQPNLFNNGATMGMNASDFVGVQPTIGGAFGAWNLPTYNAWNMPVASMNANTPASFSTTTLPYARQNAFFGQLPGMWQGEFMSPVAASFLGSTPWASSFNGQMPTMAAMNGINSSLLGTYAGQQNMSPVAASFLGSTPWANSFNGQMPTMAAMNGINSSLLGTYAGQQNMSPMMMNTLGVNGLGINTVNGVNGTINSQTAVAHLPVDVLDDGTQYLLVADLPGVKIDDLELTVENGLLAIKAVAQSTTFIPGIDVTAPVATIAREKAPVKVYQRSFAIGRDVTVENITASITNGVLTISLPKVNMVTGTPSRIRNTVAACA
ncbi:MAG: Hsp20/alpha crystallin family protein [Phycisphaerales bacterium]|nr:Hsp20/alpha crystallin family protein [Phycisphaerales bacterium]